MHEETPMTSGAQKFRELLARGDLIIAPGVYDGYSARLVQAAGFAMAATTGAGISNSLLGIDDIGVMGLSENADHCRMLARTLSIPLTADADTGYGNPITSTTPCSCSRKPASPASISRTRSIRSAAVT